MASVPGASVEGDPRSISLQRPFGVRSSSHRTGRSRSSHANTGFGLAAEQEREAIRDAIRGRSSITEEDLPRWEPHEATLAPKWYKFRWWVLNPCQRRVCKCWRWTLGEFFVVLMVLGGLVGAFKITGISEDNTGSIATIPLALTFGTVNHNSIWTFLLGIPFERALSYHKMFAYLSVLSGLWHGYNAYLKYHKFRFTNGDFLTGTILIGCMVAMILTSFEPIRRHLFEWFYYLHMFLLVAVAVVGAIHGAGIILIGFGLYGLDFLFRYFYLAAHRNAHEVELTRLPANVVRVKFARNKMRYYGGQYVFINIPSISLFQWHPFSLSSAPFEQDCMLHVRVLGNWTQALYDEVARFGRPIKVKAFIEGPYGEPAIDIEGPTYKSFMLVSGGIGITPLQSVANTLLEQFTRGRPLTKIWFVWTVRSSAFLEGFLSYDTDGNLIKDTAEDAVPDIFSPDILLTKSSTIAYHHTDVPGHSEAAVGARSSHPPPLAEERFNPLHCDYHITRLDSLDDVANAHNIHPDVQECLRFGRPNLRAMFSHMRGIAAEAGDDRVAVLGCGPHGLLSELRKLSWSESKDGVAFDYHGETFDF